MFLFSLFMILFFITIIVIISLLIILYKRKRSGKIKTIQKDEISIENKEHEKTNAIQKIKEIAELENMIFNCSQQNVKDILIKIKSNQYFLDEDFIAKLISHAAFCDLKKYEILHKLYSQMNIQTSDNLFESSNQYNELGNLELASFAFFSKINCDDSFFNSNVFICLMDSRSIESYILEDNVQKILDMSINVDFSQQNVYQTLSNDLVSYIDFAAFSGSLECFKYFIINNNSILNDKTWNYALEGGNEEIIELLSQKENTFDYKLSFSVAYHRNEISKWLYDNYKCEELDISFFSFVWNTEMLLYFIFENKEFNENSSINENLINQLFHNGRVDLIKYFSIDCDTINSKDSIKYSTIDIIKYDHLYQYQLLNEIHNFQDKYNEHLLLAFKNDSRRLFLYIIEKTGDDILFYFQKSLREHKFRIANYIIERVFVLKTKEEIIEQIVNEIKEQNKESIEFLINQGININSKDKDGKPLFMSAIETNNIKIVDIFLDFKASLTTKNRKGQTIISQLKLPKYYALYTYIKSRKSLSHL